MESAKECFSGEKGPQSSLLLLNSRFYTESLCTSCQMQDCKPTDGSAMIIGGGLLWVLFPRTNTVDLTASEGVNIYFGDTLPPSTYNETSFLVSSTALLSCVGLG